MSSFFIFSFFFFVLSIFFFQIWLQERLWLLQYPTVPPSTYLPKHFRDYWLYQNDISFKAYMELMGHIKETNIQWVVEWWHISSMVHRCCKDYYVPLVGFRAARTTPLVFQGNLESVKELLVVKVPSTLRYLLTGSWVGFVRFGHVAGWLVALLLLNTSIPLRGTSNGWRMTWSGFWGMK